MTGKELDRKLGQIAVDLRDEPVPQPIADLAKQLQDALEKRDVPEPAPE